MPTPAELAEQYDKETAKWVRRVETFEALIAALENAMKAYTDAQAAIAAAMAHRDTITTDTVKALLDQADKAKLSLEKAHKTVATKQALKKIADDSDYLNWLLLNMFKSDRAFAQCLKDIFKLKAEDRALALANVLPFIYGTNPIPQAPATQKKDIEKTWEAWRDQIKLWKRAADDRIKPFTKNPDTLLKAASDLEQKIKDLGALLDKASPPPPPAPRIVKSITGPPMPRRMFHPR